jgi:hypothetical protein
MDADELERPAGRRRERPLAVQRELAHLQRREPRGRGAGGGEREDDEWEEATNHAER